MKKNITINLFGQLYAIDEDACNLLEQYLDNMKRYFAQRDGGDEIADDIEHRAAELIADLKAQGVEAINIEHVQDIIHRIGNPEQMDDSEASQNENAESGSGQQPPEPPQPDKAEEASSWFSRRKLYRDPDDKMLGGLMSGLCKYFGGTDPLPWRIIMVVLAFASFSTLGILYLIGWMIVPEARTSEERLRMQGKPVNAATLSEEVVNRANQTSTYLRSPQFQGEAKGCLSTLLSVILWAFKLLVLFSLSMGLLVLCSFTGLLAYGTFGGIRRLVENGIFNEDAAAMLQAHPGIGWMFWGIALSTFICAGIIIYSIVRSFIRRSDDKRLSVGTRMTLIIIAMLSGATAITLTSLACISIKHWEEQWEREQNTRNGYYMNSYDRNELLDNGWEVKLYENCNTNGHLYVGVPSLISSEDHSTDYMDFESNGNQTMRAQLERTQLLGPGWYHLEAIGFAKGRPAYVYAKPDSGHTVAALIPVNDSQGYGNMIRMGLAQINATDYFGGALNDSIWAEVTQEAIRKWNFTKSESFYFAGGALTVGVTNVPSLASQHTSGPYSRHFGLYDLRAVPDTVHTTAHANR